MKRSIRQIDRMIAGYKEFGKEFFVHGNRGRKPKNALHATIDDATGYGVGLEYI